MLSADEVQTRIKALAREISDAYPADEDLHLVAILKGAFLFLGDLIRAMDRHVTIDFMAVSSYAKGTTSSGEVRMIKDLDSGLEGRNVIIVEDIVDTGLTLAYLQEILHARNPKTLRTACLLEQALAPQGRREGRVHRLHDRGPLRRGLRARLRRAVPEPALHRRPHRVAATASLHLHGQRARVGEHHRARRACAPAGRASAPGR